ncbi:MAG: glycosyltransferase family 39 protein [Endomicrobiia bacterium]|nr:glycosyltransferase family 39 protein [Endomicrobiia bacterium]
MGKRHSEKKSAKISGFKVGAAPPLFRVSPAAVAVIFTATSFLILRGYFDLFPSPFSPVGLFAGVEFNAAPSRIFEHFISILCALAVFLAAFGAGSALLKVFKLQMPPDEKNVFSLSSGLGVLALAVFALGHTGLLSIWPMAVLTGALSLVGIAEFISRRAADVAATSLISPTSAPSGENLRNEKIGLAGYCALGVILAAAVVNLLGALTPETFYDSQQYQLGLPAQWLLNRSIKSDVYTPASFFPMNVNMLFTLAMSFGGDIAAKITHWLCGVLVSYSVYVFCRRRWSENAGIFAALIFYASPAVMAVSWKTAVEMGIAVFGFASFFAATKYRETSAGRWLILSGVLCGFAIGGKYTAILYCWFPMALMLATRFLWEPGKTTFRLCARDIAVFSLAAFLACLPYLARNVIASGNPVFPFFEDKIGFLRLRFTGRLEDPGRPPVTFVNYLFFLWPLTMGVFYEGYPGAVFLCLVPLVFLVRPGDKPATTSAWIYVFSGIAAWATVGRFYLRYFVPALPVVAVAFAYYLSRARAASSLGKLAAAVVIYLSVSNIVFAARILRSSQDPVRYVFGGMSRRDYLSTQRQSYPAPYYQSVAWLNENLPSESGIMFMGETRGLFTERKHKTSSAPDSWWFIETLQKCRDAAEYAKALKDAGMTHILFNAPEAKRLRGYDMFYFDARTLGIFDDFWRKHVREIYSEAADIQSPEHDIVSMRRQQPAWWSRYASDPQNRVFVYAILDDPVASALPAPPNPALSKEFYSESRWNMIFYKAESLSADGRR